jgi:hypothetical protein
VFPISCCFKTALHLNLRFVWLIRALSAAANFCRCFLLCSGQRLCCFVSVAIEEPHALFFVLEQLVENLLVDAHPLGRLSGLSDGHRVKHAYVPVQSTGSCTVAHEFEISIVVCPCWRAPLLVGNHLIVYHCGRFGSLLFQVLFILELLFESEDKLKQHFHLLVENPLELSDEVSASLEVACRNLVDINLVNPLVAVQHFPENVALLFHTLNLLNYRVTLHKCQVRLTRVKDALELLRLGYEAVLAEVFDKVVQQKHFVFVRQVGFAQILKRNLRQRNKAWPLLGNDGSELVEVFLAPVNCCFLR